MVKKTTKKNPIKKNIKPPAGSRQRQRPGMGENKKSPRGPTGRAARFLSLESLTAFLGENPQTPLSAYLAPEGFEELTQSNLRNILFVHERLILCSGPEQLCPWAQEIFPSVSIESIASISDAAQRLRHKKIPWVAYSPHLFRRTELILDQAQSPLNRKRSTEEMEFPAATGSSGESFPRVWGTICLLSERLMMVADRGTRPYPLGLANFRQFKVGPPSRAYLKLFEALTFCGSWPQKGETCLEIGAAPGGWTWVLRKLGAHVISYDRAPLDASLMEDPAVDHRLKDAFQAVPDKLPELAGTISWIFSDIICYPEKLLSWVHEWLKAREDISFVCTIKFQGDAHYGVIPELRKIPGSKLVHLSHNKHELTWIRSP